VALLPDDPQIREIQSYTLLRLDGTTSASEPGADEAEWLEPAELERVLTWLTRDELTEAEQAIAERQYTRALRACTAAWRIDSRGATAALLRATALFRRLQEAVNGSRPPELQVQRDHLQEAARWAAHAATVDDARPQRESLVRAIDAARRRVERDAALKRRMAPINALIKRFNNTMRVYPRSIDMIQATNLRASLASLAADVERTRRKYPPGSPEWAALDELAAAIAKVLAQLRW
jgi:hypothetical protein